MVTERMPLNIPRMQNGAPLPCASEDVRRGDVTYLVTSLKQIYEAHWRSCVVPAVTMRYGERSDAERLWLAKPRTVR